MIDRTEYFKAIRSRFKECRFLATNDDGVFNVEFKGSVIAKVTDNKMIRISPSEFAESIPSDGSFKHPRPNAPQVQIEPPKAEIVIPKKRGGRPKGAKNKPKPVIEDTDNG